MLPLRASESAMVDLAPVNTELAGLDAQERIAWALNNLPGSAVLSSSFGAQAAVMLHMATRLAPDLPVVFIDTGYHFAETYRFVDQLSERLRLNLKVYRAASSPAWQEARHGRRWEQGLAGIEAYNRENKIEPMQRALSELGAQLWLAGLRRSQADSREQIQYLENRDNRMKLHPIADWTDRDVYRYLSRHRLPYHPLWHKGYISIGDWHTTRSVHEVSELSQTRFFGLKRECGLHESSTSC